MPKILNYTGAALSKTQCQCLIEAKEIRFSTDSADCLREILFLLYYSRFKINFVLSTETAVAEFPKKNV